MNKFKLRYHSRFDISSASTDEWYTLWEWKKNWRGKFRWHRVVDGYYYDIKSYARGDLAWAKKIAKHYKIEVPKHESNKN